MRVLITGGAGFLGSHVADACIARGFEVGIVDNLKTGKRENVNEAAWAVTASVLDTEAIYFMYGFQPDVIVHAAASYADPTEIGDHVRTNVLGTATMVEVAKQFGARFIYFQTSLCYGTPQEIPIPVTHRIHPENSYAISKTAGEQYIITAGIDFVSFRLANVYGPRNLSGPIPTFYKNIAEGKKSIVKNTRRDFVYVDDLVHVVMEAINGMGMGVFHVSRGQSHEIAGIYNAVAMRMGKLGEVEEQKAGADDVKDLCLEPNSLYPLPETPMEIGLKETIAWYRANPIEKTFTHLQEMNSAS